LRGETVKMKDFATRIRLGSYSLVETTTALKTLRWIRDLLAGGGLEDEGVPFAGSGKSQIPAATAESDSWNATSHSR
jgi:hypothetical protein